ncbi:MAG: zf-HC2 domain-containing protein [Candidatus Hydrogenedentes bacterium]|nr:zf-HC2 domain-containing protein [Candidatus Hydrogenedentota bacterium]
MFGCRRARGLIAAAVYEPLDNSDRSFLDTHLARCPGCRSDEATLTRVAQTIPQSPPAANIDLLPALRRRIAQSDAPATGYLPRFALAGSLGAIALFSGWFFYVGHDSAPPGAMEMPSGRHDLSPIAAALNDADELLKDHKAKDAYVTLKTVVDANPEAADAPQAMVKLADISFDELHAYKESYAIHEKLATKYLYRVNSGPDWPRIKNRWEELKESAGKDVDFASLYQLDSARQDRSQAFAKLEGLLEKYSGRLVASAAAKEMACIAAKESLASNAAAMAQATPEAFEKALNRCSAPLAKTQLTYELANAYRDRPQDASKAIPLLTEVAKSPSGELARLANDALAEINAAGRSGQ